MSRPGEWLRRAWYLLNREQMETSLQAEMEAHRTMMGEPARFGNTLQLRERSRDVWGWAWLDALVRDLRFAIRALSRTPVFTVVAALSLALGFALTAATVSIVDAYLLRSLPYPGAHRLYHVSYAPPGPWEPRGMTALDWASVEDVVRFPIGASGDAFYLAEGGYTQALNGLRVTPGFVDGLGVSVVAGRRLTTPDFVEGSERVALIGHALWRERFGAGTDAIGRVIRCETESRPGQPESFRIVGVLPPGFFFGRDSRAGVDLLVPHPSPVRVYMVGLREGVPPAAAERRLTEAAHRAASSPIPEDWTGVQLESAHERWVGSLRPVLAGVTVAVSLVLVIVCANVAVLMLLRSMQRQKEIAVRLALGSGWRHIARMLLTETTLICAAALAAGFAMTALLLGTLAPLVETRLGRPAPNAVGITLDTRVLLIVGGIGLFVAVALSLAPLTSWGRGLTNALQQGGGRTGSEGRTMRRVRGGLIAFEVAGSLILLIGCGLMIRSLMKMTSVDLGFDADGLAKSRIMLRARNYPDAAAYRRFHERFAGRVSSLAGSPVVFSSWGSFIAPPVHRIEVNAADSSQAAAGATAGTIAVSGGYFSVFNIPIRQGREFTPADASSEAAVALLSETLARQLWPSGGALGGRVRNVEHTQGGATPGPWRTVVGIAGDVRQSYDDGDLRDFYTPRTPDGRYGTFYVRTSLPAPDLFERLQSAAAEIDRDAVINPPRPVAADNQALSATRFLMALLTGFAAMAVFVSMLGIYGVTAYAVQQRRKEVAIRVALGASGRTVIRIFLRQGALLLGVGAAAGLAGGVVTSRVLRNQVYGVDSLDPATYVAACVVLLAAGFAAVFWAARRAALSNPVSGLNS